MHQKMTVFLLSAAILLAVSSATMGVGLETSGLSGPSVSTDYLTTPASITQSVNPTTITPANSVACPTDNDQYLRRFDLDGEFSITDPFNVESVDFGVETSVGAVDITVNLYTIPSDAAFVYANLTSIGSVTMATFPDTSTSIMNAAVAGTIDDPVSNDLVVEIVAPDSFNAFTFFIGSNAGGQTAPSYLSNVSCGDTEPTDTATLGFPNMHIVMIVNGQIEDAVSVLEIPTVSTAALAVLALLLAGLSATLIRRRQNL